MTDSQVSPVTLPPGAAVVAVYGHAGRPRAGIGVAMVLGGTVRLHAIPVPDCFPDRWAGTASAVVAALALSRANGVRRLRILLENAEIGRVVMGTACDGLRERVHALRDALAGFGADGGVVEAFVVRGGTETSDIQSRLNDLARETAAEAAQGEATVRERPFAGCCEPRPARDRVRPVERGGVVTSRQAAADFLGIRCAAVDALLRAGHLDLSPDGAGVTRRSLARVYEASQRMRQAEVFDGWDCREGARQAAE